MVCKGICLRYKARKPLRTGRYASGQRKCQLCEIWFLTDRTNCICCGLKLRTKPRNKKYKAILRASQVAQTIK